MAEKQHSTRSSECCASHALRPAGAAIGPLALFLVISSSLLMSLAGASSSGPPWAAAEMAVVAPAVCGGGYSTASCNRKALQEMGAHGRYISYEFLRADTVPCSRPGLPYYNCHALTSRANPYSRGCLTITRCARDSFGP